MAISLGLLFSGWAEQRARDDQGQSLIARANGYIEHLDRGISLRLAQLMVLSHLDLIIRAGDLASVQQALNAVQREIPSQSWLGLADTHGQIIAATKGMLVGEDVSATPWFKDGTAEPYVGDVHEFAPLARLLPDTGTAPFRFLDMAVPVRSADGRVTGVLGADLDWHWVEDMGQVFGGPSRAREAVDLLVIGSDGTVLNGPTGLLGQKPDLAVVRRARREAQAAQVEAWPDGHAYLTAAVQSGGQGQYRGLGWTAVARQPVSVADQGAREIRWAVLAASVLCATLFGILGWLLAGWIVRPLHRLANTADRLRRGEAVEMPVITRPREVAVLTESISTLLEALTRKQMALDQMSDAAHHDALTGLLNRAGLAVYLDAAMIRAGLGAQTLSVLCIDLDGFKAANDTHGHAVGDQLLVEVAARLADLVREGDAVARLGGDEFVLVLPTGPAPGCTPVLTIAERALRAISAPYDLDGLSVQVGCSIGGAVWPADGETIEQVFAHADKALYSAKRGGRGRALVRDQALVV
ncbi:GGDEF domain-containing protein [Roseomonas sp. E05]|uniref:sensor domain-containing diguanylate cyclase n=1 Tax=Roseomonas sp. E05 TaxID=3046310 RepID=UPI0024BB3E99|nr:GGDEF domain-containing protein [Roseomonas sp. E05]MDJ0390943.1 GGDEF domain-containing protein [Roseomonas sp. E05]